MIVKFECGCVGFVLEQGADKLYWVFKPCDGYGCFCEPTYALFDRADSCAEKSYEVLSKEKAEFHLRTLASQLSDGHRLAQVKSLLGLKLRYPVED